MAIPKIYYYYKGGERIGPYHLNGLKFLNLDDDTLIEKQSKKNGWKRKKIDVSGLNETLGEIFLFDYFKDFGIKVKTQVKVKLDYDKGADYRVVDFVLSDYNDVYVKYNGLWNEPKHKVNYEAKSKAYVDNNRPCVHLKPEDLGIIEYAFPKKFMDVLKHNNMVKELFRFRVKLLRERRSDNINYLVIAFFVLMVGDWSFLEDKGVIGLISFIAGYQLLRIVKSLYKIFYQSSIEGAD